jgi:hypothetical protein
VKPARCLPIAALLLLCGCSSQTSIWGQYFQILRESYRNSTGGNVVTMEQAAAIPYSSMAYRVDGASEALLVLATQTGGELLWTAASRVVVLTRDGRIVRSVGMPHDRGSLNAAAGQTLPSPVQALRGAYRSVRVMDFPDLNLYGVRLNCVSTAKGRQLVRILGTGLLTTRVDEACESRTPRWSYTDSYWLDSDSGFVWQSLQNLHPSGTKVQIKILRPPE